MLCVSSPLRALELDRRHPLLKAHLLEVRVARELQHRRRAAQHGDRARLVLEEALLYHVEVNEPDGVAPSRRRPVDGVVNL